MKELLNVIAELKAPKNQRNNFGNYNYRSCEDILEAVKPLLLKHSLMMSISDKIINIGSYNYIESTVKIFDLSGKLINEVTAYAREPETQKGMSDSQLTGSTASYARKYALNGIFLIDDTKDVDSQDNTKKDTTETTPPNITNTTPQPKPSGFSLAAAHKALAASALSADEKANLKKQLDSKAPDLQKAFYEGCVANRIRQASPKAAMVNKTLGEEAFQDDDIPWNLSPDRVPLM